MAEEAQEELMVMAERQRHQPEPEPGPEAEPALVEAGRHGDIARQPEPQVQPQPEDEQEPALWRSPLLKTKLQDIERQIAASTPEPAARQLWTEPEPVPAPVPQPVPEPEPEPEPEPAAVKAWSPNRKVWSPKPRRRSPPSPGRVTLFTFPESSVGSGGHS